MKHALWVTIPLFCVLACATSGETNNANTAYVRVTKAGETTPKEEFKTNAPFDVAGYLLFIDSTDFDIFEITAARPTEYAPVPIKDEYALWVFRVETNRPMTMEYLPIGVIVSNSNYNHIQRAATARMRFTLTKPFRAGKKYSVRLESLQNEESVPVIVEDK